MRPFEKIAILPFENLSARPEQSWIGLAVASIAAEQTTADPRHRTFEAASVRDAHTLRADRIISGYYDIRSDSVVLHGTVRDEKSGKNLQSFEASAPLIEVPKLAGVVAARTEAPVRDWIPAEPRALREYFAARTASDPAEVMKRLDAAIAADPSYGQAHVLRAELLARSGNSEAVNSAISAARKSRLQGAAKARLDLLSARIQNDLDAQTAALKELAAAEGNNPQIWRSLLDTQLVRRDYRAAAQAADKVLELELRDEDALNRRGYALAFAGDLPAARKAFDEYRSAYPESANTLDSLGEVLFYHRQYDEAGKLFLEADAKDRSLINGAEPFRAALCRFLLNDIAAADTLFRKYIERQGGPANPTSALRQAIWARMTRRVPAVPATGAGLATEALWMLADGNRAGALSRAQTARKSATSPAEVTLATTALLLSQPSASPDEWSTRIARALPDPRQSAIRNELLGWALLLDRRYPEAAGVLRETWRNRPGLAGPESQIPLTWALTEAGQIDEARKVMPSGWLPPTAPEPGLNALFYPKVIDLRTKL